MHGGVFDVDLLEVADGIAILRITGNGAEEAFDGEAGGHRYQQTSRGKIHSSTVTVAVLPERPTSEFRVDPRHLHYQACRATGPGGQSVNTADSAIQLTHIPTGLMVRAQTERSQLRNKELALALLTARLWDKQQTADQQRTAGARRQQVGSGMRSDKAWTVRYQDGIVTQHATGRKIRLRDYLDGNY